MKKINGKKLKFGINNTVIVALAVVIVILLNVLVNVAETKIPQFKVDLTENAVTKISKETKSVLKTLAEKEKEIELTYLVGTSEGSTRVCDVLEQYDSYSDNVTYKSINYHTDPLFLSSYSIPSDVNLDGAIVVSEKDNKQNARIIYPDNMEMTVNGTTVFLLENLLTGAIGAISTNRQMKVGFTTDHNEVVAKMMVNAQGVEEAGGAALLNLLDNENISAEPISLNNTLPELDLLVILAPEKDFSVYETNVLDDYLLSGGNVLVCLPWGIELTNLESYLETWGITAENNYIRETDSNNSYDGAGAYYFTNTTDTELVKGVQGKLFTSYARSLNFTQPGDNAVDVIVTTSANTEAMPIVDNKIATDNAKKGQYNLAYKVEKPLNGSWETTAKLFVTGSTSLIGVSERLDDPQGFDTIVNYSLTEESYGNKSFVMSILSDAFGEEIRSVHVPLKSRSVSYLDFTAAQAVWMQRILCIFTPALILLAGFVVWLRRRNK